MITKALYATAWAGMKSRHPELQSKLGLAPPVLFALGIVDA
jgi:hypothetical protein